VCEGVQHQHVRSFCASTRIKAPLQAKNIWSLEGFLSCNIIVTDIYSCQVKTRADPACVCREEAQAKHDRMAAQLTGAEMEVAASVEACQQLQQKLTAQEAHAQQLTDERY